MSQLTIGSLTREGLFSLVIQGAAVLCGLMLHFLFARFLGPVDYGIFSYAYSLLILGAMIGKMGLETTSLRFLPEYCAANKHGHARGLVTFSLQVILLATSILIVIGILASLVGRTEILNPNSIAVLLITLPILSMLQYSQYFLRGLQRVIAAQFPEPIVRPLIVSALFVVLLELGEEYVNAQNALILNSVATAIALVFSVFLASRHFRTLLRVEARYERQLWMRSSLTFLLITGLGLIHSQIDLLIVGSLLTPEETGIFSVGLKISSVLLVANYAINSIVAPRIALFFGLGRFDEIRKLSLISSRLIFGIAGAMSLIIWWFRLEVLGLLGPEYIEASGIIGWLLGVEVVRAFFGSLGFLLSMTDRGKEAALLLGGAVIVNMVLDLILIPALGPMGAAIGSFSTMIIYCLFGSIITRRTIGTWSSPIA